MVNNYYSGRREHAQMILIPDWKPLLWPRPFARDARPLCHPYVLIPRTHPTVAAEGGLPSEEPAELPGVARAGQAKLHGAQEQTGGIHAARTTEERAHAIAMNPILRTLFMTPLDSGSCPLYFVPPGLFMRP